MRAHRKDEGQVTAFVVVITTALLLLMALVLDGGRALAERSRALALAQEAARAGAQELDLAAYRAGDQTTLAPQAAEHAALEFLHAANASGTAAVDGDTVIVTTELTYSFTVLPLGERTVRATASASPHPTPE